MKILTVDDVSMLIKKHSLSTCFHDLMKTVQADFENWKQFTKMPRPAMHVPDGVLELMPICDNTEFYAFKYVNCHPKNPDIGKQTVVATGQLSRIETGYPVMFSEMTILTALRTAATSALATNVMARKNAKVVALIGTGAQSEFQIQALRLVRDITTVQFFDIDPLAMDKFQKNMQDENIELIRCSSAQEAVSGADIVTVCTACKAHVDVIKNDWVKPGMHINALGGDTIGKTELELSILSRSRVVVEYFEQSLIEGEIQRLKPSEARQLVSAELYQLFTGEVQGRTTENEITLFDSVGIALEDYSVLKFCYQLLEKYELGTEATIIPALEDPKDLFGLIA